MAESLTVIGDVSGRTAVLIDDMIDTGGTMLEQASASTGGETGAGLCDPCGVFPTGFERLSAEGLFEQVVVTNSIPIPQDRMFLN